MRLLRIFSLLSLVVAMVCCRVEAPDFEGDVVSIAYLKSRYREAPLRIADYVSVRGVVVSSDQERNFYKEIVIQDASGAILIRADVDRLYEQYPPGSSLTLRCHDLVLGEYGGRLEIGTTSPDADYQTGRISSEQLTGILTATQTPLERPETLECQPCELKPHDVGKYVKINGLHSPGQATWAGNRWFYTAVGDSILVRTSDRATFAADRIPDYPIDIYAVLGWFNGTYQLLINSCDDIYPSSYVEYKVVRGEKIYTFVAL